MQEQDFVRSLDTLCASLCAAMGIAPPKTAAAPNEALLSYTQKSFSGRKADRIFLYNPDAITAWIARKYSDYLREVLEGEPFSLPMINSY